MQLKASFDEIRRPQKLTQIKIQNITKVPDVILRKNCLEIMALL
jgi:hypothetical protein